jgi:hypothetical protein
LVEGIPGFEVEFVFFLVERSRADEVVFEVARLVRKDAVGAFGEWGDGAEELLLLGVEGGVRGGAEGGDLRFHGREDVADEFGESGKVSLFEAVGAVSDYADAEGQASLGRVGLWHFRSIHRDGALCGTESAIAAMNSSA